MNSTTVADTVTSSVEQQKKMKRILANRQSARESYQRKKKLFVELQDNVQELKSKNQKLSEDNDQLRKQVEDLKKELDLMLSANASTTTSTAASLRRRSKNLSVLEMKRMFRDEPSSLAATASTLTSNDSFCRSVLDDIVTHNGRKRLSIFDITHIFENVPV